MNVFKKTLCIILVVVGIMNMMNFIGCNSKSGDLPKTTTESATTSDVGTTAPVNFYTKKTYKLKEITDKLNILGRCVTTDDGLTADWSASGFEFVADCKNILKINIASSHDCRFNIYMDGGELKQINVSAGKKTYTVLANIEEGVHSFRFVKSSMVEYATKALAVTVESIELYGEITEKAKQRAHFIEFVGDSITCGVGASSPTTTEAFSELSYAYLLANKLDLDYSLVSVSGIGAGKSTERHGDTLMGDVYPLTNYYRSKTEKYTPERKADIVVINLNTNDKGNFGELDRKLFVDKVKELVDMVKATHGEDVKIIWLMGMMSDPFKGYCDIWTIEYLRAIGGEEAGYYFLMVTKNNAGGATHPIASAHETVAKELEAFIIDKGLLK